VQRYRRHRDVPRILIANKQEGNVTLKSIVLALSLLCVPHGATVAQGLLAPQPIEVAAQAARDCSGLGCNRVRPVTQTNPFGIDFGWDGSVSYSGVPSRALAMLKGQTLFAASKCPGPSAFKRSSYALAYMGIFGPNVRPDYMQPFSEAVDRNVATYEHVWQSLDEGQRSAFCEAYLADVEYKTKNFTVAPSEFYLLFLAPLSEEGTRDREAKLKRAEKMKWLAVFGQVLSVAAQVSAGRDAMQAGRAGLADGRAGNLGAMDSQMARSAELFGESAVFANAGQYMAASGSVQMNAATGEAADLARAMNCNALLHFAKWDAPPDATVWGRYQSLSSDCVALDHLRK